MPIATFPQKGFRKKFIKGVKNKIKEKTDTDKIRILNNPNLSASEKRAALTVLRVMRNRGLRAVREGTFATKRPRSS